MLPLLGPPFFLPLVFATTKPQLIKLLPILAGVWLVIQLRALILDIPSRSFPYAVSSPNTESST